MIKKISAILFILSSIILSQTYEYYRTAGQFENASSFYITANGFIYITDSGSNELIMMDTSGALIKSIGGYGWDENSFDDPMDVFADPLSVYVADKNNHSIKRFDKNLNYISSLYTREDTKSEIQFGYPVSCATSNQGDLYFIDSENKRIMKFDIYGNFKSSFGGLEAGKYELINPLQLSISSSNNVYVIDGTKLIVFDQYGNGITSLELDQKLISVRILFDNLIVCTENEIFNYSLRSQDFSFNLLNLNMIKHNEIISSILFGERLFVLTKESILIFNKIS